MPCHANGLHRGKQVGIGYHQGTIFPNTSAHSLSKGKYGDQLTCEEGCLFHVSTDETESVDQKEAQPELFSALLKRMHEVGATTKTTGATSRTATAWARRQCLTTGAATQAPCALRTARAANQGRLLASK